MMHVVWLDEADDLVVRKNLLRALKEVDARIAAKKLKEDKRVKLVVQAERLATKRIARLAKRPSTARSRLQFAKALLHNWDIGFWCDKRKNGRSLKPSRKLTPKQRKMLDHLADSTHTLPVPEHPIPGRWQLYVRFWFEGKGL